MTDTRVVDKPLTHAGYRHEALIYTGQNEFLESTLEFINVAVRAEQPVLVVLDEDKIEAIEDELGVTANAVVFADMTDVGANPARIIGLWHNFLAEHGADRRPVRGIGEPIYAQRTAAELAECQLHEALLNVAFADAKDFWLLCPYDLEELSDDVLAEALRTHPFVANGTDRRASAHYEPPDAAHLFGTDLPAAPARAVSLSFGMRDLPSVRVLVAEHARRLRFHEAQIGEAVTAVNELATNSVTHGGGGGTVLVWTEADVLHFEIADAGQFDQMLAGRIPPDAAHGHGRGLWIVNQLCDLLQIRTNRDGTRARGQLRRVGIT